MAVLTGAVASDDLGLYLSPDSSPDEVQTVIRAVYKQVLGNPHLMESERLVVPESQLKRGEISVREFVRLVAKSDFYRARFFESAAPYRFVELNFKHLLGRAPLDQAEVSKHIRLAVEQGYDAEIDSYIDSDEYQDAFGEDTVPYPRTVSQTGQKQVGFNRLSLLLRGGAEADKAIKESQLVYALATNSTNKIEPPQNTRRTDKLFRIVVSGAKYTGRLRRSTVEYLVPGDHMTAQIQRINRTSGTIVSITEVL
ncbi:phycobilisome rod-core linker polypeptide [Gloeobacter kilaueensis]|uniref:Phycobilisome linker polypeptide n=1 Tax=Gloeobacter kilaueensis (strain ATCC BAA-2537 / CCAP 1431/1 / ULC 316 / JS1) TaxID=1183438 RepID=U5QS69_GLOK1|nr:phycobilisome rod-core linker polypeptide [Gloeobacter kilaueensis]AGY60545.1 phycobilisome linker polypeptide [Gloeobacter kilaueensis JS1]